MDEPISYIPTQHAHLLPSLVKIHMRCIMEPPYTPATFLPPLNEEVMTSWWQDRAKEVEKDQRVIIMQMASNATTGKEEVAGVVMLEMPVTETGPFRGEVQKLLVPPEYRKMGVTSRMMAKLENVAREKGRKLLGNPAEFVYPKLGYIKVGEIPGCDISPLDGSLKTAVYFYKDMR
ncbi:uncharacterized protein LY89DRAFT_782045 [Mollisia scopiformis]|uniref:N-acetyltransferase domain-containing protein n=1 Tax=Mollisia scopiformis TaxID=149040 RepID=A0A194X9C4_MOLSC|nr:uncharacterized protein LY89DRAFT_782045 [Mollisia scopiformis]KUJ16770.1 hypothetical protein LY89DRAFT_782045 [Mollisia scopiformis]